MNSESDSLETTIQKIDLLDANSWDCALEKVKKQPTNEKKLQNLMEILKYCVSKNQKSAFQRFFQVRNLCLELFKENLAPTLRVQYWLDFIKLSQEGCDLKKVLGESAHLECEKLHSLIQILEKDLAKYEQNLQKLQEQKFPKCQALANHLTYYKQVQKELNFLSEYAQKIYSLREAVLKISFQFRSKNLLMKRLVVLGEKVFPKTQSLKQELGEKFKQDVNGFIQTYFASNQSKIPYYLIREEIKALQTIAKQLSLPIEVMIETRSTLSKYWDQLKLLDKRKTKPVKSKPLVSKNHTQKEPKNKPITPVVKKQKESKKMPVQPQVITAKKPDAFFLLKKQLSEALQTHEKVSLEQLKETKKQIEEKLKTNDISIPQENILKDLLCKLSGVIVEKEQPKNLQPLEKEQLHKLLEEAIVRKKDIQAQIKKYRKILVSSGLDFDKGITYNELLESEKNSLCKINAHIEEIEKKLRLNG